MAHPTKRQFDYGHPDDPRQQGMYDSNGLKSKEEMPIDGGLDGGMRRASADDLLGVLGYASELTRSRSTWQVAFMSFVLASVPYGLSTTMYYPLVGGGPSAVIWGWVAVCLVILCLAISLGEITSVYPTAGGVYYQTYMICPPWCRRICAYLCGWSYFLGNVIITLSVNFGTTLFFVGCVNIFTDAAGEGIWVAETYHYFLVFLAITLICNAISSLCNRWLPILDTFTIFFTFAGVLAIIICALAIAKNGRNSASYAFGSFEPTTGYVPGWSYCIGLLHAAYATSATGMILSMCEEVRQPATQVPKAMVGALLMNMACGFVFLVPLMFVLPTIADVVATSQPLPFILASAVGNEGGAFALTVPIIVLGILCGTSCTTAASRCTWAFSRDGAIPGSKWWKQVNTKLDVPLNAMMLSMGIQIALGCIYFGSTAAFNAFIGSAVIFLTFAYASPVLANLLTGRKCLKMGVYDFKAFGYFCNVVTVAWSIFITPLYCFPVVVPVTAETMNYACVVFVFGVACSAAWYYAWGRKHYHGPPAREEEVARRRSSIIETPHY